MFANELETFKRLGFRHVLLQTLNVMSALALPLMLWQSLIIATNCELPIVVVLSLPQRVDGAAFSRGDLLFLTNLASEKYNTGDITVYKVPGADIPIVHRVIEKHEVPSTVDIRRYVRPGRGSSSPSAPPAYHTGSDLKQDSPSQLLLTKGDNNPVDDTELYRGLEWLEKKHVVGKVKGFLPYVGYVSIAMNDNSGLKHALLVGLWLMVLL